MFGYFLLDMAEQVDLELSVDIYEPRSFDYRGPAGCNHCGGIVSEFLVQLLSMEGINLPTTVVQRGIDSYVLHMDVGEVRIATPLEEKRIAAVYRGNGPRGSERIDFAGFDRFLQDRVVERGALIHRRLVSDIRRRAGRPLVLGPDGLAESYDLVAVAAGINTSLLRTLEGIDLGYSPPTALRTFICEFDLGREGVDRVLGSSMHVFLLDIPRLDFAAVIPKGEYATLCLLGHDIDEALIQAFLGAPEVKALFPKAVVPSPVCHCFPRINIRAARRPYGERIVMVGDCGVTRLYKDGIGGAYRTAKAAARAAVFHGVSESAFAEHFAPACRAINRDNAIGRAVFTSSHVIQRLGFLRRGLLRMTKNEQCSTGRRPMSGILWDLFTGSAPYRDILKRSMRPDLLAGLCWNVVAGNLPLTRNGSRE